MIWIEMIGPGGVGKSFLNRELCKQYRDFRPYEWVPEASSELRFLPKGNHWRKRIHHRSIQRQIQSFRVDYEPGDEELVSVFLKGLSVFTESAVVKLELSAYFQYRIREMKFHEEMVKDRGLYFSEDGLIHLSILGLDSKNLPIIKKPDWLIFINASESYVRDNRIKRMKDQAPSLVERSLPEAQFIQQFLPRNYRLYQEKANLLKEFYGSRFIELNVEALSSQEIIEEIYKVYKIATSNREMKDGEYSKPLRNDNITTT